MRHKELTGLALEAVDQCAARRRGGCFSCPRVWDHTCSVRILIARAGCYALAWTIPGERPRDAQQPMGEYAAERPLLLNRKKTPADVWRLACGTPQAKPGNRAAEMLVVDDVNPQALTAGAKKALAQVRAEGLPVRVRGRRHAD